MSPDAQSPIVNPAALEPLFLPHEEPYRHRVRGERDGGPAKEVKGRRPSPIDKIQNIRHDVNLWRLAQYVGASDTSRELLHHWFGCDHQVQGKGGALVPFRYYFCQREAIETLVYLMDVRRITTLSGLTAEYASVDRETQALGIDPEEDRWARYAFKVATGAGKTKIMSLAVVWSYFHALRESDSPMARHFVVIAPNLTVFERLKEDFGDGVIFRRDPLIPEAWKGDCNLRVVLQGDAGGAATGGTLYLTNIHRLYEPKRRGRGEEETYAWAGPPVSKARALDTGEALRERITGHARVMVLNDEAHHVWDPDSAWNEAIEYLHETIRKRSGGGLAAQLDFSATPKDNKGLHFKHIVVDTPLGEAVDAGIVKTPIIGRGRKLIEQPSDDAAIRYQEHLMLGYQRWLASQTEWEKSGKKPLLFIMTEDTTAADQIARAFNTDPLYKELNGKTINLHTRLKGKLKKKGKGEAAYYVFEEDEKEISEDDLAELRKLSRELDDDSSPFQCIVSVLMLREGWDVRNVTTIVPLRPYSSKANILPEQTLGRGLRRMTLPGQAAEVVTVVDHPAFASLYRETLSQEGVEIDIVDVEKVPRTTVTIFPDEQNKDVAELDLAIPRLTPGYQRVAELAEFDLSEVKRSFQRFRPLPPGEVREGEIQYEGRHLFTNEVVEQMNIRLPLLQNGWTAISFFHEELCRIARMAQRPAFLRSLIKEFLETVLFTEAMDLNDQRLVGRLADADVREHVRATFIPLILERTIQKEERLPETEPQWMSDWRPFQATHSERHPAVQAQRTLFNLVPCNRELEVALTTFLDRASDVAAFAKNAGPQALRLDYVNSTGQLSLYTPDFIVRTSDRNYMLIETKGREDPDVPLKARAAVAWCDAASKAGKKLKWVYLYVPQGVFGQFRSDKLSDLLRTCTPALSDLVKERAGGQLVLPFADEREQRKIGIEAFIDLKTFFTLPSRDQQAIAQAVTLFEFYEHKEGITFGPIFQCLLGPLEDAARGVILERLLPALPAIPHDQQDFFKPYVGNLPAGTVKILVDMGRNLQRTLVYRNGLFPLGLLAFCLEHARDERAAIDGVFAAIRKSFADLAATNFAAELNTVKEFRNKYIAHAEQELTDRELAKKQLGIWLGVLAEMHGK